MNNEIARFLEAVGEPDYAREVETMHNRLEAFSERLDKAALDCAIKAAEEAIRQRDLAVEAVPTFVAEFARFVGGDGEFWLHELEDFLDTWKKMQDYTIKESEGK